MQTPDIIALIVLALIAVSFWKLHRDPDSVFNIFDLIMDNGRLSRLACVFLASFGVISWIIIRLALDPTKEVDWPAALGVYGGLFVAPVIAKLFSLPPPTGKITTTQTASQTTEVKKEVSQNA